MPIKIELSIIVPTINRKAELVILLQTIEKAVMELAYEIIIIDQNQNGFLDDLLVEFDLRLNIKHINVNFKGLSKAKNYGATLANGNWLCFPDDDCRFFPNTIQLALQYAKKSGSDIVFGKCIDTNENDSVMNFKNYNYILTLKNMSGGFVEATGFVKKHILSEFNFDESMGAGCFHGAEEGYDWLYRILKNSEYKVSFNPLILFYHPQIMVLKGDQASLKRVFTYRCGFAKLCFKHKLYFKYFKRVSLVSLSLPFYMIFNQKKVRYYSVELLGLLTGILVK